MLRDRGQWEDIGLGADVEALRTAIGDTAADGDNFVLADQSFFAGVDEHQTRMNALTADGRHGQGVSFIRF